MPSSRWRVCLFEAAFALATIEGVEKFEQLRRLVSPKSDFAFGLSMEFASEGPSTSTTTRIPTTSRFVAERWMPEVSSRNDFTWRSRSKTFLKTRVIVPRFCRVSL